MKKILFFLITMPISVLLNAQTEKCGTMQNLNEKIAKDPSIIQRMEQLEQFTQQYILNKKQENTQSAIITIPVVVHVIHNGEAIGTGTNISDAQVISQIDVLNEDFRLQNADSLQPSHPFWQYTADAGIEFCLAEQDEFGTPTTGIERYNEGQPDYSMQDMEDIIKPSTIWDRDLYLNLWTCEFDTSAGGLLGYAQFPGNADSTDGVVIRHSVFGTFGTAGTGGFTANDLGRTGTHEVGHWLNLRHIWGDTICGNDFCADTPEHEDSNYGCPAFPHRPNNNCVPGTDADGEMYMNYMDYVDDSCMVMFTYEQGLRMDAALNGARSTLLTSAGCTPPVGINELVSAINITIYPNPTSGKFTLDSKIINGKIEIYNVFGEKILEQTVNRKQETVNLNVPNGVYFLQVKSESGTAVQKLIIQK